MKRIAIFCDGTWNRHDARHPTNVVRLSQAVQQTDIRSDPHIKQYVYYQLGVGSGRGTTPLSRLSDRVVGGAMGLGLMANIIDAYRNLVFMYEPGDEIYVFGFSRGAFTARSLISLIRYCGILSRDYIEILPKVVHQYQHRSKASHPDDDRYLWNRCGISPHVCTSTEEMAWRDVNFPGDYQMIKIKHVGIFDTVGALGVPGFVFGASLLNRRFQFHNLQLSRSVQSARHAVSIDERRSSFKPTLWQNLDALNKLAAKKCTEAGDQNAAEKNLPYRQEWFPGDHGSVGGGGDIKGLTAYSFEWIFRGAQDAGLAMDESFLGLMNDVKNLSAP